MRALVCASKVQRLPVVGVYTGEDVAEIRDIVYDPEAGRVVGLTLNKRGFFAGRLRHVLPSESIHAIGEDAVMIMDESFLADPQEAPDDVASPATDRNVLGNEVLTEGGARLGVIKDVVMLVGGGDSHPGEVVGYQIEKPDGGRAYIPLPAQLSVSGSALVVPAVTEEFVRDDLVGLGAAIDEFRERLGLG